ncbi:MAG TPA: hypothetical protein VNU95_00375 [Candidatus Acidoferrales bacterium]|jgi:hypothetical protein|nr:hypothetical protein [Candidatus Acidoferrales bacterium]
MKIKKIVNHGKTRWRVNDPRGTGGKRQRKFFETKEDAEKFARQTFSDISHRPLGRLKTPLGKATQIINHLVEGVGIRATARLTKKHPNTVQSVLEVAGSKSAFLLDRLVREVNFPFVQVDEMFCFVGCKEKNNVEGDPQRGRQSIFLGVDADSKFIINWMIGKRTSCTIERYMQDLRLRVARPFQLSTDGYGRGFNDGRIQKFQRRPASEMSVQRDSHQQFPPHGLFGG